MYKSFDSGEHVSVKKRQIIDTSDKVFTITTGFVGVYIGRGKNRRMLVMMKEGNIFPLVLTADTPLWQSAVDYVAMSDAALLAVPRKDYLRKRDNVSRSDLEQELEMKTRGNNWLMERVVNLLIYDVSKRLYMRLILLADFLGTRQGDTAVLDAPITYVDIAESIGTTRETVNRLITSLQKDGILSIEKRVITIHSLNRLEKLYRAKTNN